jgi:hypothetical protein
MGAERTLTGRGGEMLMLGGHVQGSAVQEAWET